MTYMLPATLAANPATVSEGELFAQFLESDIIEYGRTGKVRSRTAVRGFLCGFESFLLDEVLEQAAEEATDDDCQPSDLETLIQELKSAAYHLRTVLREFEKLKREQVVSDEDGRNVDGADRYAPMLARNK